MDEDHLLQRYHQLRQQLTIAYAAADWDRERIDEIARQMLPIERALASSQSAVSADTGSDASALRQAGQHLAADARSAKPSSAR